MIGSKQQFDMSLNGAFQPPNILSVTPNMPPRNKIPQPPNKNFFRAPQELCSGVPFKNSMRVCQCMRVSLVGYVTIDTAFFPFKL